MNLTELNSKQYEAVTHIEGPALVIAGAGSGKTRVLTHRIANLIFNHQVDPHRILAITFTNKAANEMRERIELLIEREASSMWVGTFHSICVRILRSHIEKLGYYKSFAIFDTDDQKMVIKDAILDLNLDSKDYDMNTLRGIISQEKNNRNKPEKYIKQHYGSYRERKIGEIYQLYEEKLKKNNALDFDDLIIKTLDLLEQFTDVGDYYRNKFEYILVDEYQDTNRVQYLLVKILGQKKSSKENVFVVGDEDQSIYGWRGADIQNILDFEKDFPAAKVIKLEQNYRSTQNILQAANSIIENNTQRIGKNLWTEGNKGDKIQLYQANSEKSEALHIAERVYNEKNIHRTSYNDIAVLMRTRAQTRSIEERFLIEGIPYVIVGGQEFYGRKEIKDLLAYLRLVQNPQEDYSFRRVVNEPKRGIGKRSLENIMEFCESEGMALIEAYNQMPKSTVSGKVIQELKTFAEFINQYHEHQNTMTLFDLVEGVFTGSGLRRALEKDHSIEGQSRLENIQEFFSKVKDFEDKSEEVTLEDFLTHISLLTDIEKTDVKDRENVTLMTVHSAKGLEYDVVIVAGLEEKLFPILRDSDDDLEEERRLFYVALTRARKRLYLTYAQDRMVYGRYEPRKKSRFIEELPSGIINTNVKQEEKYQSQHDQDVFMGAYTATKEKRDINKIVSLDNQAGKLFKIGDKIKHKKWNKGTVVQVKGDEITVAFGADVGIKVMMMPYAPIQKINE